MAVRLWAGWLLVGSATAFASVPRVAGPRVAADTLTAMPAASLGKPLRTSVTLQGQAVPPLAWSKFSSTGTWQAAWDPATGVPRRIWGSGVAAPGAMASAAVAEQVARQVLADHIALLAPGAAPSDFVLVSNVSDGDLRCVGFVQTAGGRTVVGGQISFRFKHDRLFVIGSEALPNVNVAVPRIRLAASQLRDRATAGLRTALRLPNAPVSTVGTEVILPLVADGGVLGYRLVAPITIDGGVDGRYQAYIDPSSAGVIAVQQLNEYAVGSVLYHGIDRYPSRGRIDYPAFRARVAIDGAPVTTTDGGTVAWSPDAEAQLQTSIVGDLVTVVNVANATAVATTMLAIDPGGQVTWDASAAIDDDAQVNAYIDTNLAKEFVRNHIDATMPTLDDQMIVNVNLNQTCNSFFDGKTLNLFMATPIPAADDKTTTKCENTARVQDVNFHEYGHRLHTAEIIPGVGAFDGAMSEGAADFLAASITGDSGMGRGFFYNTMPGDDLDTPIRELDPPNSEWSWPVDIGEIHHQGLIFGGTFWDLRKLLISELGTTDGVALTLKLYRGALRSATDIPTSLIEALATDDDDGDLSNGTPHECEIRNSFGRHGLRTATGTVVAPGHLEENALSIGVVIEMTGLSSCGEDQLLGAKLQWKPPYTGVPAAGSVDALPAGPNRFFAQLPLSPQESVYYRVHAQFTDGSEIVLADNLADPFYQLYTGFTKKLYCTDFENGDPLAAGWTSGTNNSQGSLWSWGIPTTGITDPHAAFSGTHVLSLGLDGDYRPSEYTWVKTPEIDVGAYSDVRVQYRRWLAVDDSYFDQARVTANDAKVWQNFSANLGTSSATRHIDKEWRFHDVPVSGFFRGHKLTVGWDLRSDGGLQFGGWALDDVCVVANPFSICGDGVKSPTEGCDAGPGNADIPDACRTDCEPPQCGDGIIDTGEECDAGSAGSPSCSTKCTLTGVGGGGCCSVDHAAGGASSMLLGGAAALLIFRRRRR